MIETSIIIAVIVGLVQVVKGVGMPSRYASLFALVFGVAASFAVASEATVGLTIFNGLVLGLSSAGLYSGTKATLKL